VHQPTDLTEILFRITLLTLQAEEDEESEMFASVEEPNEALRATGYIADSVATTTVYLANCLHKPLLLLEEPEAERPSSHTPSQKQPARTLNVCSDTKASMKKKRIGKFDEPLEKLCVERKARSNSVDCDRCNSDQNVSGGMPYLAGLMWRFHNDLRLVAAAYYVREEKIVQRVLSYRNPDVVAYVSRIRTLIFDKPGAKHYAKPSRRNEM
jgi:hypothetical protein